MCITGGTGGLSIEVTGLTFGLGAALSAHGALKRQFKKALSLLRQLERKYDNSSLVYGLYGTVFYELSDYKNSYKYFKKVLAIKPKSEVASLGLFQSLIHLGKESLALKELDRYCAIKKPELYLLTIKELMENINGFELSSHKKIIQKLFSKWANESNSNVST